MGVFCVYGRENKQVPLSSAISHKTSWRARANILTSFCVLTDKLPVNVVKFIITTITQKNIFDLRHNDQNFAYITSLNLDNLRRGI